MSERTVQETIGEYVQELDSRVSKSSARTYAYVMGRFSEFLESQQVNIHSAYASQTSEAWIVDFLRDFDSLSPSTQQVARSAVVGWYRFLKRRKLAVIDLEQVLFLARPILRIETLKFEPPSNQPQVAKIIAYVLGIPDAGIVDRNARLRLLRDRALILTLADTGIEVTAACNLRWGNIDLKNHRLNISEGSNAKSSIALSPRLSQALHDYLSSRRQISTNPRRSWTSQPIFVRHNMATSEEKLPINHRTAWNIIRKHAQDALGQEFDPTITPKSFRRYYELTMLPPLSLLHPLVAARSESLFNSGHYEEAVFNAMKAVEERVRSLSGSSATDVGAALIAKTMQPDAPMLKFSSVRAEQESAFFLFRGALGSFKNPSSHRFLPVADPAKTFECLALASLLMRMLDEKS